MPGKKKDDDKKQKTYSLDVEIFAVGTWNGMPFEREDLFSIASAFNSLSEVHQVPLKFGHNDEQPMTDGFPALGWVKDVWVQYNKLMARFTDVPEIVYNAIKSKLYRNVSVELDMGVEHKGRYYSLVLSGVALLGADIPAVNTLADLKTFMGRDDGLKFDKRVAFTAVSVNNGGVKMPTVEELEAALAAEKAKTQALEGQVSTFSAEKVELEGKVAWFEAENKRREENDRKAMFSAKKTDLTEKLDGLVKSEVITPAQREKFMADWKDDEATIEKIEFAVSMLGDGKADKGLGTKEAGKVGTTDQDEAGKQPDEILTDRTYAYMRENKVVFSVAKREVLRQDPKLATEYRDMNGTTS